MPLAPPEFLNAPIDLTGAGQYACLAGEPAPMPIAMLEVIEKLLVLQDRDRKILHLKDELAHILPAREEYQSRASSTHARQEAALLHQKQLESQRKQLELDVETLKGRIERYGLQQFQTKKNEEYRALAHEIETCKDGIRKIEDQELDIMEAAEAAQKETVAAVKEAAEVKKLADDQLAALAAREANLNKQLAVLESDREQLASAVDEVARGRYERLLKNKGRDAIVGITNGVCGGCHMVLQRSAVVSCAAAQGIINCPNCGRILYCTPDMNLNVREF